nr:wall-associated receptor kinase-like 8 [Quercus suber]
MRWSWFMPYHFFIKRREERKERERAFYENGSKLLEKLIASCNAKPIPIRTFSPQQLRQATNNFSSEKLVMEFAVWYEGSLEGRIVFIKGSFVRNLKPIPIRTFYPQQLRQATNNYPAQRLGIYWYKGSLEGRIVLIKRSDHTISVDFSINDLVISAQMSAHSNVLKPIGCCLHTPSPIFVFEFAANGVLADRIYVSRVTEQQHQPMVWERRLKIARQIAHALSYLHTAFPRPVIYRGEEVTLSLVLCFVHSEFRLSERVRSLPLTGAKTPFTYSSTAPAFPSPPGDESDSGFSSEKLVMEFSVWYEGSLEGRIVLIKRSFVCNAKPIPIRTFSPQQLRQATNNYPAQHLGIYWYKGSLEGRIVLIKRLDNLAYIAINDIVISAQLSGHSNVLKPIGCCLHTPSPFLAFEFAANADVYDFGRILLELLTGEDSLNITRFTIDKDSTLVAYIHNRAQGSCINEIVDPAILAEDGDGGASLQHQLQAVVDLALTCTEEDPQTRPTMVDVIKQLRRIERFTQTGEVPLGNLQNLKLHESFEELASASLKRNASSDEIQAVNDASERPLEV